MNRPTCTKEIAFCFGHRLFEYTGLCANIHGHNAKVSFTVGGKLTLSGFVIEFGDIKRLLKTYIDENFDHALVLHEKDPLGSLLESHKYGDRVTRVPFNPTAENLAKFFFDKAQILLPTDVTVLGVTFYETETSYATYEKVEGPLGLF